MAKAPSVPEGVIIDILTGSESNAAIAERLGFHRNFVSLVRTGRCYASVAPELIRRQPKASCGSCVHWSATRECCDLGVPEYANEGERFARICPSYAHQPLPL
jgi:hypothetical protein